jgi:MFS family permease
MAETAGPAAMVFRPPGRTTALVALALAIMLGMATWFSASAVGPQLRVEWDLSTSAGAWLTIAVQLGFVAGAVVSAALNISDVFPARLVYAACAVGAAAANALLVTSDGPALGIPLRALTGFFMAGVYPPLMKVLSTWYRPTERGTALGLLTGAIAMGAAVPHLVNAFGGASWETVVWATSALTLAGVVIGLLLVRDGPYPFPAATFDPGQFRKVFRNRGVRLASLGYFGHMWELFAMWAWFSLFLADSLAAAGSADPRTASLGTFAVIGAGGVGCWLGGVLGDRWGRSNTTALAMAISGTCSLTIGFLFGRSLWLLLPLGLVWGATVVADSAQFSTAVTEVADQSYVGTALTLQYAVGFTLTVATIWLVPIVRDASSWGWAFAMLAPGPALGIAAMLRLRGSPEAARIAGGRG